MAWGAPNHCRSGPSGDDSGFRSGRRGSLTVRCGGMERAFGTALYRASQLLLLLHQAHEIHLPSLERRVAKPDIQTMLDGQHDTDAKRRRNAMTSLEPARKFILKYPDYL